MPPGQERDPFTSVHGVQNRIVGLQKRFFHILLPFTDDSGTDEKTAGHNMIIQGLRKEADHIGDDIGDTHVAYGIVLFEQIAFQYGDLIRKGVVFHILTGNLNRVRINVDRNNMAGSGQRSTNGKNAASRSDINDGIAFANISFQQLMNNYLHYQLELPYPWPLQEADPLP